MLLNLVPELFPDDIRRPVKSDGKSLIRLKETGEIKTWHPIIAGEFLSAAISADGANHVEPDHAGPRPAVFHRGRIAAAPVLHRVRVRIERLVVTNVMSLMRSNRRMLMAHTIHIAANSGEEHQQSVARPTSLISAIRDQKEFD